MSINRLPCELLEIVLLESVPDNPPVFSEITLAIEELGWIVFLHVCRLWRSVALHSSRAWAEASTHIPHKTALAAVRARTSPLNIELSWRIPTIRRLRPIARFPPTIPDLGLSSMFDDLLENECLSRAHTITLSGPYDVFQFLHTLLECSDSLHLNSLINLDIGRPRMPARTRRASLL